MVNPIENFDDFVLDAFEPDDYPGDDAMIEVDQSLPATFPAALPVPARDRWEISDDGGADWALRRVHRAVEEIERARSLARHQIEQITRYVDEVERREQRDVSFFEAKLRDYYETIVFPTMPKKGPFTKPLPSGRLKSRAGSVSVVIDDEDKLREWLLRHEVVDCLNPQPAKIVKERLKTRFGGRITDEVGDTPAVVDKGDPTSNARRKAERRTDVGEVVPGVKFVRAPRGFDYEFEDGGR